MAKKRTRSQRRFGDSDLSNAIAGRVFFRLPETQFLSKDELFTAWRTSEHFRRATYAWFRNLKAVDAQNVRGKERPRLVDLIDG